MQKIIRRGPLKGLRLTDAGESILAALAGIAAVVGAYSILVLAAPVGFWQ